MGQAGSAKCRGPMTGEASANEGWELVEKYLEVLVPRLFHRSLKGSPGKEPYCLRWQLTCHCTQSLLLVLPYFTVPTVLGSPLKLLTPKSLLLDFASRGYAY